MGRRRRILLTLGIIASALLVLFGGSALFLNANITRIKVAANQYVEKNSAFTLEIARIKVNIFSSVSLIGIKLKHKEENLLFTAESLKVKFHLWDLVRRRSDFIGSIRLVEVKGLTVNASDLSPDDFRGMWKIRSSGNTAAAKVRVAFLNSRILYKQGSLDARWNILSLTLDPGVDGFKSEIVSRLYLLTPSVKYDTDVRGSMTLDPDSQKWNLDGNLSESYFNGNIVPDIALAATGKKSSLLSLVASSKKTLNLNLAVTNGNGLSGKMSLTGFDLSDYSGLKYRLYGDIGLAGTQESPEVDISLNALHADGKRSFEIRIRDNILRSVRFKEGKKETASVILQAKKNVYEGVLNHLNMTGKIWDGKFDVSSYPNYGLVSIRSLQSDGKLFLRDYQIEFWKTPKSFVLKSKDNALKANVRFDRFSESLFQMNLSFLKPIFLPEEDTTLGGEFFVSPRRLSISGLTLNKGSALYLDNSSVTYDFSKAKGTIALVSPALTTKVQGGIQQADGKWDLKSLATVDARTFPFNMSTEKMKGRDRISWSCGNFLSGDAYLFPNAEVRLRNDIHRSTDSPFGNTSGIITAQGSLTNLRASLAQADLRIYNYRNGPLLVPLTTIRLNYEEEQITFKADFLGRTGKAFHADGILALPMQIEAVQVSLDSFGSIMSFDRRNGNRAISVQLKNFDLVHLEPYLDPKTVTRIGGKISMEMVLSQNNLFSLWTYFDNAEFNDLLVQQGTISARSRTDGISFQRGTLKTRFKGLDGKITLIDGLIRAGAGGAVFTSVLDFQFNNASRTYSGLINLTGKDSPQSVDAKIAFSQLKIDEYNLPKYEQYLRFLKKEKILGFSAENNGLSGSLLLKQRPSFSLENIQLSLLMEKMQLLEITGKLKPSDVRIALTDIRIPIFQLRYLSREVKNGDGDITGNLQFSGPVSNLQLKGELGLRNCTLRLVENVKEIRSITGTVGFFGDSAEIADMRGLVENTPIQIDANVDWHKSRLVNYRFDFQTATNSYFYVKRFNDIQGYVTGKCRITLEEGKPLVSADISLRNMDLTFPFSKQGIGRRKRPDILIDLDIKARNNVTYFQNLNNINLQIASGSRIHLKGAFKKPLTDEDSIVGLLTSPKGKLDYLGTTFTVRSAKLAFSEQYDNVKPYLEFKADAKVKSGSQDIIVYLEGEGLLDNDFVPRVYSLPSMPRKDIVRLLGYGQLYDKIMVRTSGSENEIDLNDSSEQELNGLFLAGILTYFDEAYRNVLVRPVERRIKKILKLDKLEITPGLGENIIVQGLKIAEGETNARINPLATGLDNTSIVVGKYLTDFLFLEYMMNLERRDVINLMDYNYQQHLRLEFDFRTLSFEWKYKFPLSTPESITKPKDNLQFDIKWRKTF